MSSEESSSPARAAEAVTPSLSASQQAKVRAQLDRVVASSLFRNSKRFPEFLRYTVGRALDEDTDDVKERTIGVEVFGREPNYDTNVDPIVRVTAAAVRKRLAHYYREIGHEHELRIEFARGSYVPEFRFPAEGLPQTLIPRPAASQSAVEVAEAPEPPGSLADTPSGEPNKSRILLLVILCLAIPYVIYFARRVTANRPTALDDFWAPAIATDAPVLVCIPVMNGGLNAPGVSQGQSLAIVSAATARSAGVPTEQALAPGQPAPISYSSSLALSSVSAVLGAMQKSFRVRHTNDANLSDLEDGPVILIGGFGNRWTMQLDGGLRFDLANDGKIRYIEDLRNSSSRAWQAPLVPIYTGTYSDYALISRVQNPTTGRVVFTIAGLHGFGTQSAAECVSDSTCLTAGKRLAPGNWKSDNLQVVVQTTVIGGDPGEPKVIAAYVW